MNECIKWLKDYFRSRNNHSENPDRSANYFEAGLIDSLGLIELIDEIETKFNIRFNQEHFQDRRFSTIEGLAEIIEGLRINERK
tara:strand:- start:718 stop:969 length:252 start_codon:yes stop_codon:yes gene_type:complete